MHAPGSQEDGVNIMHGSIFWIQGQAHESAQLTVIHALVAWTDPVAVRGITSALNHHHESTEWIDVQGIQSFLDER